VYNVTLWALSVDVGYRRRRSHARKISCLYFFYLSYCFYISISIMIFFTFYHLFIRDLAYVLLIKKKIQEILCSFFKWFRFNWKNYKKNHIYIYMFLEYLGEFLFLVLAFTKAQQYSGDILLWSCHQRLLCQYSMVYESLISWRNLATLVFGW
jgi:hypothetical protein